MMEVKTIDNIQLLLRSYYQQQAIIITFSKLLLSGTIHGKSRGLVCLKCHSCLGPRKDLVGGWCWTSPPVRSAARGSSPCPADSSLGCTECRSLSHPLLRVQFHSSRLGLRCSLWWPQVDALPRMPSLTESIWPELTMFILGSICYFSAIPIDQVF